MFGVIEFVLVDLRSASDAELAAAIGQGRDAQAAEEELCRRFGPRLRLYGLRHLRNEDATADLVQHALIVMLESLRAGRVRDPEKLASFLLGTCRMAVLDIRRGAQRRDARLAEYARTLSPTPPADLLDTGQLQDCLQRLPERERTVVVLTFYDEQSSEGVAASLGLTAGNARVIRHRALQRLRECLTGAA